MAEEFSVLGKRLPRKDALAKTKGELKFIADIQLPGMLEAKFLRSPYAHARITRIDTSQAEALPGVRAVLTHKNVPKIHPRGKFEYLLDETVHYAAEEVAAVAAITKDVAEEALKLIEVEYEVLPAVFDAEEAMKPGAPLVHPEYGTNMFHGSASQPVPRAEPDGWLTIDVGDVDRGFAEADYIIEDIYETPLQYHCSPMPRSVVCEWTGDELTCYADTQVLMRVYHDLAKCLGIPQSRLRVICNYCVGCYGGKEPEKIATLAALLAKRSGKPVRAVFTREEDVVATRVRPEYKGYEKIGVKKDGTITAMYSRLITNFGRDNGRAFINPLTAALNTCTLLYKWQNSKVDVCTVMTNTVDGFGMNAFGDAEANFMVDRLIDEAAEKIGMDPVEFRLKNCLMGGDKAQKLGNIIGSREKEIEWGVQGSDMDSSQECIKKVAEKAQWQEKWKGWKTPVAVNGAKRRGIGIAFGIHHTLYAPYSAIVEMHHDGTAHVLSMGAEIGQGFETAVIQVVAETLGLHYEDVGVVLADSAVTPLGLGNFASMGVTSGVTATWNAALDAKRKLFDIAAQRLGVKPDELEAKDRRIYVKERPEVGMPIAQVCLIGFQIIGSAVNPPQESLRDEKTGKIIYPFAAVATIVEVEVDTETGELDVLKITSAHDCGRAINPQLVENQIHMSITLVNGWVRSEEFTIDKNTGVVLNPNLLDYKIMTILDMPKREDFQEIIVEFPCTWAPFGVKGMSETGTVAGAPAIANAVYNAIGVRIRGDHLTPDRILRALGK